MNLDRIDILIIDSLMEDGRKSFRQISREINVSAPTVELHFNRMRKSGIIKNIEPVIDVKKIDSITVELVYLKVNPLELTNVVNNLTLISEIKEIFTITGDYDILVKVIAQDLNQINELVNSRIYSIKGVVSVSSQVITKIIKDESSFTLKECQSLKARCIYCYNDIKNHPKIVKVTNSEKYFCCNSCLVLYKKKYGELDTLLK